MKNTKNIATISLAFVLVVITYNACNENSLDVAPTTQTEDSYFQHEYEFQRAVDGIYAKLTDLYWYAAGQNNCVLPVQILPGDDITTGGQDEFEIFSNLQPASSRVADFYKTLYQLINRSTIVIDKNAAADALVYDENPALKGYHRGEAMFMRGYANYLLWNVYGTAPLYTKRVSDLSETTPGNSTGTQLLDQAITDLSEAATLLPPSWAEGERGRVTQNSANGMLGKALVFRATVTKAAADYQAAIAAFDKITTAKLVPRFDDNFAFDTENNEESLFEFQATQAFSLDNIWLPNDFDNAIGSLSVYWGFYSNDGYLFGKQPFIATQKLVDIFDPGDPRRDTTVNVATMEFRKYVTRNKTVQVGGASVNNHRILRYADVLLLKAEALNESNGSTADAIALINQVRTRARGANAAPADRSTAVTDRAVIRQWIMDERLMELAGEGQRWFDLRRWHIGQQITLNNGFFSSAIPDDMGFNPAKHLNFPIPTTETNSNPNVKQNDGY